jgi:branched-chain amino acid transport system ATP-binding protein
MSERTSEHTTTKPTPPTSEAVSGGAGDLLMVTDLSAWYGEARVLTDVSVTVAAGEVATLVGRNGAGKTTLLRSVMGLQKQVKGAVTLDGVDLGKRSPDSRARAGIGWVPDDRGIYASLSVEENLLLPPVVHESAWSIEKVYDHFPVLAERRDFPGTKLSGGEQQMLAMARVLRMGSRLLLLDEPSEGLAPVIVQRIGEIIREIKSQGVGVLLVEQNVAFARSVADRHYLLAQGRVVEHLTNDAFAARESELLTHLGM